MNKNYDHILPWVKGILSKENPSGQVIAYNFGLTEKLKCYSIYLIGSKSYDENNDDWACNESFVPREREINLLYSKKTKWSEVLDETVKNIQRLLKEDFIKDSFLESAKAITVGFDDGDLIKIKSEITDVKESETIVVEPPKSGKSSLKLKRD